MTFSPTRSPCASLSPVPLPHTPSRPPTVDPLPQVILTQDVPAISIPATDSLFQGAYPSGSHPRVGVPTHSIPPVPSSAGNPMPSTCDTQSSSVQDTITLSRAALTKLLRNFSSQFTHAPAPSGHPSTTPLPPRQNLLALRLRPIHLFKWLMQQMLGALRLQLIRLFKWLMQWILGLRALCLS